LESEGVKVNLQKSNPVPNKPDTFICEGSTVELGKYNFMAYSYGIGEGTPKKLTFLPVNDFKLSWQDVQTFVNDMALYLGLPYDGDHFRKLHELGYLPIKVKSLPEGIETKPNIPHMTFINTIDGFAWLTLYLETIVSSLAWKPSTSATIAKLYRRQATIWIEKTDPVNRWLIDYMCHDFSARGLSPHDMLASGLGHATSFRGSDTLTVIPAARYFYNEPDNEVCINSVNASEHSVSTTKIFTVGEQQMLADWMVDFPSGILSVVSDTFDLWKLITVYLPALKDQILARDGKLVIRPDSGDPVDIICGKQFKQFTNSEFKDAQEYIADYLHEKLQEETPHGEYGGNIEEIISWQGELYSVVYEPDRNRYDKQYYFIDNYGSKISKCKFEKIESNPSDFGVIELLWDIFGGSINEQGYKVLDSHIGCIYGDSITLQRQEEIYKRLGAKGFAASNIILGIGSFTYQYNTRDVLGFAAKGAWFEVINQEDLTSQDGTGIGDRIGYDIYKEPVTDDGTKKSLKGLQVALVDHNNEVYVKSQCSWEEEETGLLRVIYEDGKFYNQVTLTEVRSRLNLLK
jgi:nicotinamide phosphoribosyltransferase